jgi:putative acetyltransferase
MFEIREDDLSGAQIRALLALHLSGLQSETPPEFSFALDIDGLRTPDMTVWSAWDGPGLVGMAALKMLGDGSGEVKSMRTDPRHLRRGVAAALLEHVMAEARRRSLGRLSLETGVGPAFEPALALYRKSGFVPGEPFADYAPSPYNQFLHLEL